MKWGILIACRGQKHARFDIFPFLFYFSRLKLWGPFATPWQGPMCGCKFFQALSKSVHPGGYFDANFAPFGSFFGAKTQFAPPPGYWSGFLALVLEIAHQGDYFCEKISHNGGFFVALPE